MPETLNNFKKNNKKFCSNDLWRCATEQRLRRV